MPGNGQSYLKPGPVDRILGRTLAALVWIGLIRGHFYVLEVRGRKSGKILRLPVKTSGSTYIGNGSNKLPGVQLIPNQFPPSPIRANFTLETTNLCASVSLPLTFELVPGSDGTLLPQSTVSVGGVT
jgi:hypothetical protein